MADLPIYTCDIETDPFKYGRRPEAFDIGFYDGEKHVEFWGSDCVSQMRAFLETLKPGIIYFHNGGKFDVLGYCMDWVIGNPMRVINNRIVKGHMKCSRGWHQVRDSYSIMPFALGRVKGDTVKQEIDIKKLEKKVRQKHKAEIQEYRRQDCKLLFDLCTAYREKFGDNLTVGGTAMKQIRLRHDFEILDSNTDSDLRKHYFYGGRVECFRTGVIQGDYKVYDVNSMYPYVMKTFDHPVSEVGWEGVTVIPETCFLTVQGMSYGAFPTRDKDGLAFPTSRGVYHVSRHEFDAALETGLFECEKVLRCVNFERQANFGEFVDYFYQARLDCKKLGDGIGEILNKYLLNSGYGKFAQSPDNYCDYMVTDQTENLSGEWELASIVDGTTPYLIWKKPSMDVSRYNVATGASITGAARSVLLRAIGAAKNVVYCDTDCVVCEELPIVDLDSKRLGAWKLEATADRVAIARKKLYAFFQADQCVKMACKGVKVSAEEILRICQGETVVSRRDAPSFKLDGTHRFIERKVRMK